MDTLPAPLIVVRRALARWWSDWISLALVNVLWGAAWFTLILGPPATFGAFASINRVAHDQSATLGEFFAGARRYFLISYVWLALNVIMIGAMVAGFLFYTQLQALWAFLPLGISLLIGCLWIATQLYALPYLIEQDDRRLLVALRNGLFTILASPGYMVVITGVAAAVAVVSAVMVAPLFLGGLSLIALLASCAVADRIQAFRLRRGDAPSERQ